MELLGPLAVSLAGLRKDDGLTRPPREAVARARAAGARAVVIDAAADGTRPRQLDRSGRRDLAALLRREELGLAGLDLWIPPEHFVEASSQQRAVDAMEQACVMAHELAGLAAGAAVVSVALHEKTPPAVLAAVGQAAEREGVVVADHSWPERAAQAGMGTGVDPATLLAQGVEPAGAVMKLAAAPTIVRLSDWNGAQRVAVGQGKLSVRELEFALAARGYSGYRVLDLRGVMKQDAAASAVLS